MVGAPIPDNKGDEHLAGLWLHATQARLAERVGEPLFITIRLVYDGSVDIDVETFSGRHGDARGGSLSATLEAAVDTLLYLDRFQVTAGH